MGDAPVAAGSIVRLTPSQPFSDPELVRNSIQVSAPHACTIGVDSNGIQLHINGQLDKELIVSVSSAFGTDGSYLELPADFHIKGSGAVVEKTPATSSPASVLGGMAPGDNQSAARQIVNAGAAAGDEDVPPPPPAWPPCCPWPPR